MIGVLEQVKELVYLGASLPGQVFKKRYSQFVFFYFEDWNRIEFWPVLQDLLRQSCDEQVTAVFAGQPEESKHFHVSNSGAEYEAGMCRTPYLDQTGPIVWYPTSLSWVVWGEWTNELLVLGCDLTELPCWEPAMTVGNVLSYVSKLNSDRAFFGEYKRKLLENYSDGEPWVNDAPMHALQVANQLLDGSLPFLEACRELADIKRECESPVREMLAFFAGIDNMTRHLPVGKVRLEWDPAALAVQDQELNRIEAKYRQDGRALARELVNYLKKPSSSEGRN